MVFGLKSGWHGICKHIEESCKREVNVMGNNFDVLINRKGTRSEKWDYLKEVFGEGDLLPMWVADMDFLSPGPVIEAVKKRACHGVYGYTGRSSALYDSIVNWMKERHGWNIDTDWLTFTPGVVPALNAAVNAFTRPGDKVIIQSPVYHPFFSSVENNGRRVVNNLLSEKCGRYYMDLENLENQIDSRVRMLILCSPQNPVGRVWSRNELEKLGELCLRRKIIIVSDEIHSDIIYKGSKHIPIASISPEFAENTVTCIAPSKTFNIAGLSSSVAIIPDENLRNIFNSAVQSTGYEIGNIFGNTAMEAAYSSCSGWLDELLDYLEGNADYLVNYVNKNIPKVKVEKPEGTYLAWLDFRELGLEQEKLKDLMVKKARVGLNSGTDFGISGEGFMRLNFGCPRSLLEEGLKRIEKAIKEM